MSDLTHDPELQRAVENPWYTEDQFEVQLNQRGGHVVRRRWAIFEDELVRFVGEKTGMGEGLRILDAGCGDGINSLGLTRICKKRNIAATIDVCDYNALRLDRVAKLEGIERVLECDLREIPVEDSSYDFILCNHVLEHIAEKEGVLAEFRRVLDGDGILLLNVPNEGCLLAKLRNFVLQREILKTTDHVNFFTKTRLDRTLVTSGWFPQRWYRRGFFLPHMFLNSIFMATSLGRQLLDCLGRCIPGQAADLMVVCGKSYQQDEHAEGAAVEPLLATVQRS